MANSLQLPALRQDLGLHAAAPEHDGSPGWVLHDAAANRFYRLGWPAFEILSRWPLGTAEAIVADIHASTTLQLHADDVAAVVDFLSRHHLLQGGSPAHTEQLTRHAARLRLSPAKWLLKHYLFFRLPLLQPMPLLARLAPLFERVFTPGFWYLVSAALLLGLLLVLQRWDAFTHTFANYQGMGGLLGIGLSLSFAKLLHEFGHALTAYRYGCRVPAMGVAFLVMFPVLYTDTNEAWKLASRRQRLQIGAAGMLAELVLAVFATLLWNFLPDGPLRAGVFMLATTTWLATLAINASPFMRFDGYFLLSDWLGIPNLHSRAFAFGRCWLRRQLLGLDEPLPEAVPAARQRMLTLFAFATWLYRLVLFLGIALVVYHYFFKALGIFLLLVELGWFIAYPLWSELSVWWQRRTELRWNRITCRSVLLLLVALLWVAVPWRAELSAPAVMGAQEVSELYAPAEATAEVVQVWVQDGQAVQAGQRLLTLRSPELVWQRQQAEAEAEALRWQLERQPFDDKLLAEGLALQKQWQLAQQRVNQLQQQIDRLGVRAPRAGRVVDRSEALQVGTVIPPGERLLAVIDPRRPRGEAFVDEAARMRLTLGGEAVFVANLAEQERVQCRIDNIDRLALPSLDQPALASSFGGPIATQQQQDSLQPLSAQFRVRLSQCDGGEHWWQEMPGVALLEGERQSLLQQWLNQAVALLQREAGL